MSFAKSSIRGSWVTILAMLAGSSYSAQQFQMGNHFQFCDNFFQGTRRSPHPFLGAQISQ